MVGSVGLTDAKIRGLKPPKSGQVEAADGLVTGLRVRIGASGTRTFILRKRVGGSIKNITLGRFGERFTLGDARKKARSLLIDIDAGRDPTPGATRHGRGVATVRGLWEQYLDQEVRDKKRTALAIERTGKVHILPALGDRMADSITRGEVTQLVDRVTYRNANKPTPREGRSVHQQLSAFYSWAMPRLDKLPANPCRDAGRPPAGKPRDRHLTQPEVRALWLATEKMGLPFGPGFRLLLLTGLRRGEVFEADRAEIDGKVWTIPAARSKNGVTHIVPLSSQALDVLKTIPIVDSSRKLFPSAANPEKCTSGFTRGHSRLGKSMAAILDVEAVEPFTLHDIRRTVATGMQRIGIAQVVVEAVLNHVSGSRAGVAGIYQRHDYLAEKQHALLAWAAEVERIVAGAERGNVVALHG